MVDYCVHLIDDDEDIRRSLSYFLSSAGFPTRLYSSAEEFLANGAGAADGCIVTDIKMPGLSGLELVTQIKRAKFPHAVVVMSGEADVPLAVQAMKEGAADFLEKPFTAATLIEAVRKALASKQPAGPRSESGYKGMLQNLSARQRQVLDGILEGKTNKVIARDLGISPRTVETYRHDIMAKTQAGSLSGLVKIAMAEANVSDD